MIVEPTELRDVLILTPKRFGDERGWFCESWNRETFASAGIACNFVQDNHSYSASKNTLRGLHYQSPPAAQDKLVRCTRGAIRDVAVDVRAGSPDFGKWVAVVLTSDSAAQLFIPKGFLHGFVTLNDDTEVQYKCSALYDSELDGSVRFDSAELGINWGVNPAEMILSRKDERAPDFSQWNTPFEDVRR